MNKKIKISGMTLITAAMILLQSEALCQSIGQKAPSFTLKDIDGKSVSLSEYKGKVVYIDFWATWCGPCMAEMPHGKTLREKYKDNQDVVFLYVSFDNEYTLKAWEKYVKKNGMNAVHLYSNQGQMDSVLSKYNVSTIPRYVLVDMDGNIANPNAPGPSQQAIVCRLIDSLLENKKYK